MENVFKIAACIIIGYFVGGMNTAYFLGRLKGFDIRTKGTGNPGASNVVIVMGKGAGIFCAIFDIIKAASAVLICGWFFPDIEYAKIITGTSVVLGHIFPVLLKFRGGKGLAALAGVALAFDYKLFLILLLAELVLIIIVDYICLIPTTGSVLFTIIIGIQHGWLYSLIFLPVTVVILFRHIENFRNIINGVEYRIRLLWKREQELQRVEKNREKLAEKQNKSQN